MVFWRYKLVPAVLIFVIGVFLNVNAQAQNIYGDKVQQQAPGLCWETYAECTSAAFGDEGWRSGCYADFSMCLGTQGTDACTSSPLPAVCTEYDKLCTEFAEDNAVTLEQCKADVDVCAFAHGC